MIDMILQLNKMKKLMFLTSLPILFAVTTFAFAGDLEDGLNASYNYDYKTAFKKLLPLAKKGNVLAQSNLGLIYLYGRKGVQDIKKAKKWLELAAKNGNSEAQFRLGSIYEGGWHEVPEDHKKALKWLTIAAEQGDAKAQFSLGEKYSKGQGIPRDYKQAVEWYRKAAEQGDHSPLQPLGDMYASGLGVMVDFDQAEYWYRKALEHGYRNSSYSLWGISRRNVETDEKMISIDFDCGEFKITIEELHGINTEKNTTYQLLSRMTFADAAGNPINFMRTYLGEKLFKPKCEDLNNDGTPELILHTGYKGGNCCFTQYVYELKKQPEMIFSFDTGNAAAPDFRDLDSDGLTEIVIGEDRSADLGFCYTCTPWLEYVFCYKDGKYRDCTLDFPDFIRNKLKVHKSSLEKELKNKTSDKDLMRDALGVWGNALLLGEGDKWWKYLKSRLPADDFKWLKKNQHDFKKEAMARLNQAKTGIKPLRS